MASSTVSYSAVLLSLPEAILTAIQVVLDVMSKTQSSREGVCTCLFALWDDWGLVDVFFRVVQ